MKLPAKILVEKDITIDCFGCDHCKPTYPQKKQVFGLIKTIDWEKAGNYCDQLGIPLTKEQVNLADMTAKDCPCHFTKWSQTNTDYEITYDMFKLTLQAGDVIAEIVMEQSVSDNKTENEK
jgi:hypothetical protein